jgi:Zn-dependent metalloprotease
MLIPLDLQDDPYPIQICNFQFSCIYSGKDSNYSNLGQNIIDPSQESFASLMQTFNQCYENTRIVLDFLETRLYYSGLDNNGRDLIVNINCVDYCRKNWEICFKECDRPQPDCEFLNACFVPYRGREQFIYGQKLIGNNWQSLSNSLTIVAHEIFHAVTYFSCNMIYDKGMSGALHESYSDIFAVLVFNRGNPDINKWVWTVGDPAFGEIRDLSENQNMYDYKQESQSPYDNMKIHNYAAYKIITATDNTTGKYLFDNRTEILPVLFYEALKRLGDTDKSRKKFTDSRAAINSSAASILRSDDRGTTIIEAIKDAFDSQGIY